MAEAGWADERPNDHDRLSMTPHDPPESCPACSWLSTMCHCPEI